MTQGQVPVRQGLSFVARGVRADNWTNQPIRLKGTSLYVPPWVVGWTAPLSGTITAEIEFAAPPNVALPAASSTPGIATIIFVSDELPMTTGMSVSPYASQNQSVGVIKGTTFATDSAVIALGGVSGVGIQAVMTGGGAGGGVQLVAQGSIDGGVTWEPTALNAFDFVADSWVTTIQQVFQITPVFVFVPSAGFTHIRVTATSFGAVASAFVTVTMTGQIGSLPPNSPTVTLSPTTDVAIRASRIGAPGSVSPSRSSIATAPDRLDNWATVSPAVGVTATVTIGGLVGTRFVASVIDGSILQNGATVSLAALQLVDGAANLALFGLAVPAGAGSFAGKTLTHAGYVGSVNTNMSLVLNPNSATTFATVAFGVYYWN